MLRGNIVLNRRGRVRPSGPLVPPEQLLSAAGRWWTPFAGVTESSGDVTAWQDQVNSQSMVVGANTTPNLVGNYVSFDGVGDALDFTPTNKAGHTRWYFGIWRYRESTSTPQALYSEWGSNPAQFLNNYLNLSGVAEIFMRGGSNQYALCTIDTWEYEEVIYNGTESTPADRIRLYRNRIEIAPTGGTGTLPASVAAAATSGALGRYSLGTQYAGVRVHACYTDDNNIPSDAERDALMAYSSPI